MAPLRSLGNALSSFRDFYARTGTDALGSGGGTPVSATGGTKFTSGSFTYHIYTSLHLLHFLFPQDQKLMFL